MMRWLGALSPRASFGWNTTLRAGTVRVASSLESVLSFVVFEVAARCGVHKIAPETDRPVPKPRTLFQRVLRLPPMMLLPLWRQRRAAARPGSCSRTYLDVLFGLRVHAWSAVAAAVPVELQQWIDRYFGPS